MICSLRIRFWLIYGVSLVLIFGERHAFGEVPTHLEPTYSEAVLAYNGRDFNKSLQLLDNLLQQNPNTAEFLELKALVLKMTHDDKSSAQIYLDLIRVKSAEGKGAQELAPYHFELGVMRFRENNEAEARTHLSEALKAEFNTGPCHFFLGLMDYRSTKWADSEAHFEEVLSSKIPELRPAAHYYLAQIFMKLGSPTSATQNLFFARNYSKEQLEDENLAPETKKIAQQIYAATEEALKPFDRSGYFGNVSLFSAFDSNVLVQGTGVSGVSNFSTNPTGLATIKETLLASIGYSTSPLKTVQYVPSYRTSFNLNFNDTTRSAEFFVHDLSLYITRNALARTSYGLKLESTFTFQDQPDVNNSRNFTSYSFLASIGPYLRYELKPKMILNMEFYIGPQRFFTDSGLSSGSTFRRSGVDFSLKTSIRNDQGNRLWNPGGFVLLDYNGTEGSEFRSTGVTAEFNNVLHLAERLNLNLAIDLSLVSYSRDPSAARFDRVLVFDANAVYKLSQKYSVTGDIQATNDGVSSSDSLVIAQYQYSRVVVSLGFTYSF